MNELEQRRLDRLNAEYKQSPDYIEPVFSSRRLFWMTLLAGIGVAMVSYVLLTEPTEQPVPSSLMPQQQIISPP